MFNFFRKKEKESESQYKREPKFNINDVDEINLSVEPTSDNDMDEFIAEQIQIPIEEKTTRDVEFELFVGSLVICISKELENPKVGVVTEVTRANHSHIPLLMVYDIVTKEKFIPDGVVFSHTEQKFDALNNIEPNARIALFFHRIDGNIVKKQATKIILTPEEWKKKVNLSIEKINNGDWS